MPGSAQGVSIRGHPQELMARMKKGHKATITTEEELVPTLHRRQRGTMPKEEVKAGQRSLDGGDGVSLTTLSLKNQNTLGDYTLVSKVDKFLFIYFEGFIAK